MARIVFCEFVPLFAMCLVIRSMSFLCNHVSHIVSMRSKEQMLGVYARWVIAAMQNLHFGTKFKSKKTMRGNAVNLLDLTGIPHMPISIGVL